MAKALVIKNSDFYSNRLDHVDFVSRPCTALTLSQSQATVAGSLTLVATPVPVNTTDAIVWSSSDDRVATVSNGVVTAVDVGTADITAICGSCSAVCHITVTPSQRLAKGYNVQLSVGGGGHSLLQCTGCSASGRFAAFGKQYGTYPIQQKFDTGDIAETYPIPIPTGAKTINLTIPSNYGAVIIYYDKDVASETHGTGYVQDCAKVLDGQTPAADTDWSIPAWVYGNQTFTIPENSEIDSYSLTIYATSTTTASDLTIDMIGITYGYQ